MADEDRPSVGERPPAVRDEKGMAMVITMLLMVLLTALGVAALLWGGVDSSLSGNYKYIKNGDAAADAAMDYARAMIFLPATCLHINAGIQPTWATCSTVRRYSDSDMNVTFVVKYKTWSLQGGDINYPNDPLYHPDQVVRYGQDYQYAAAPKPVGTQPVYTVTVTDNKTGAQSQADIISTLGFMQLGALFVKGTVTVAKKGLCSDEIISFVSGSYGDPYTSNIKPALVTASLSSACWIQHAITSILIKRDSNLYTGGNPPCEIRTINGVTYTNITGPNFQYTDDKGNVDYYYAIYSSASYHERQTPGYLWRHVYSNGQLAKQSIASQRANQFIQFLCNSSFNQSNSNVIEYHYTGPGSTTFTDMIGCSFSDLESLSDVVIPNGAAYVFKAVTAPDDVGGSYLTNSNAGFDASNLTFGTAAAPLVVFFNSTTISGRSVTDPSMLTITTKPNTQMNGFGVLVINGDAKIVGSINWTGLMLVKGNLFFRPWQGGNWQWQSSPSLASNWNGFIAIGGNLDMLTLAGGTLRLGYGSAMGSSAASTNGIVTNALPEQILQWRRIYK